MNDITNLKTTNVYGRHWAYYRQKKKEGVEIPIIKHEGGSRSSKTVSLIQYLLYRSYDNALKGRKEKFTIARLKMTWLRATLLKDFEWIIREYNIPIKPDFNPRRHDQEYTIFENEWMFTGLDEKMKLHGRKQDRVWINEAMECNIEDFMQLEMRTQKEIILDYNPMSLNHWIYELDKRPECRVIKSTQIDNDFLPDGIRKRILSFEPTPENIRRGTADQYYWDVYGLGKRAVQKGRIFTRVSYADEFPKECKWTIYGLDFGYTNDPTALVKVGLFEGKLYVMQLIYETGLTNVPGIDGDKENIHSKFEQLGISDEDEIIADSAEQKSIKELKKHGWNVKPAEKGPDSVKNGIDTLKRYEIVIVNSPDLDKEFQNYKWAEDKNGNLSNKPVDSYNHGIDSIRYSATKRIKVKKRKMGVKLIK